LKTRVGDVQHCGDDILIAQAAQVGGSVLGHHEIAQVPGMVVFP